MEEVKVTRGRRSQDTVALVGAFSPAAAATPGADLASGVDLGQ